MVVSSVASSAVTRAGVTADSKVCPWAAKTVAMRVATKDILLQIKEEEERVSRKMG